MTLTDVKCKNASAKNKTYKLYDSNGLYLEIAADGKKFWRYRFKISGRESRVSVGRYPDVSLKDARKKRDELAESVKRGIRPTSQTARSQLQTVNEVFNAWITKKQKNSAPATISTYTWIFNGCIKNVIGGAKINELRARDLLIYLDELSEKKSEYCAARARSLLSQIFDFAVNIDICDHNTVYSLRNMYKKKYKHHPTLTEHSDIKKLLIAIDKYKKSTITKLLLQLSVHIFLRSGEMVGLEWDEVDTEKKIITIEANRMKMRRDHVIPLSDQALKIVNKLKFFTSSEKYVFPSYHKKDDHISKLTATRAFKNVVESIAFSNPDTSIVFHGIRAMASTLLNDSGYRSDLIETQLSHAEKNAVRAAYNRAQYLDERRKMMQFYSDLLDKIKNG